MSRYAVVDAVGKVLNVVLWDEQTPWQPPAGATPHKLAATTVVSPGSTMNADGTFNDPPVVPVVPGPVTATVADPQAYQAALAKAQDSTVPATRIAALLEALSQIQV